MRALSVLVLATFLAGPGLRAECLLLCAKTEQTATRSSCHDDAADTGGPALDTHHDCATIAPAVVTAVKRTTTDSTVSLSDAGAAAHTVLQATPPDCRWHDPPRFAPPATHLIPLRI